MRRRIAAVLVVGASLLPLFVASPALAGSPGWIVKCSYSHSLRDDPVVHPGHPGMSHLHDFFGNREVNADSTYESMVAAETSCTDPDDTAGYWVPALYRNGVRVLPQGRSVTGRSTRQKLYYRKSGSGSVTPFPPGFTMIIGNSHAMSEAENTYLGRRIDWGCADNSNPSDQKAPVNCPGTGIITLHFDFPSCWDGTYVPLANEVPQMKYPSSGACPVGYLKLPRLIQRFEWPVGTSTGTITLASGAYYTAHADFVNTWDQARLEELTTDCLNANVDCGTI